MRAHGRITPMKTRYWPRNRVRILLFAGAVIAMEPACGSSDAESVAIRSIEPAQGTARGGDTLTIRGTGFDSATHIRFGDTDAASVSVVSGEVLEVVTPMHLAGAVDVVASTGESGSAALQGGFSYLPLELSYREAPAWYLPSFEQQPVSDAVAADFNGDGHPDLLVAVRNQAALLLENSGSGSFAGGSPPDEADAGLDAGSWDASDDDASDVDAGVSDAGESDAELEDAEAKDAAAKPDALAPDAGKQEALTTWKHDTQRLVVADFNADGAPDVFLCNQGGQANRLLLNDGAGSFKAASSALPDEADDCRDAVLIDVNGDSQEDLVVLGSGKAGGGKSYVRIYLRTGDEQSPVFEPAAELEEEDAPVGAACGSISASPAEATATATTTDSMAAQGSAACALEYDSAGVDATIRAWFPLPSVPILPDSVELDLRSVTSAQSVTVRVRDANNEVFTYDAGSIGTSGWKHIQTTKPVTWTPDGEGDGIVDVPLSAVGVLITPTGTSAGGLLMDDISLNVPDIGTVHVDDFERRAFSHAWDQAMTSLSAGDLNGDGMPELLVASDESGASRPLVLLSNDTEPEGAGPLAFRNLESGAFDAMPDPIAATLLLDVDEDGDLDVVAGAIGGQDRYLSNDGNAHFFDDTLAMMPVDRVDARSMVDADLDLDGRKDLLVANHGAVNRIYLSRGPAGFRDATPAIPLESGLTQRLVPLDADGDGDLDIFVFGAGGEDPVLLVSVEKE